MGKNEDAVKTKLLALLKEKRDTIKMQTERAQSPVSHDNSEAAQQRASRQMLSARLVAEEAEAAQIEAALERLEEGKYGVCLVCQKSISAERLEALPHAVRCMGCKAGAGG